MSEKLKILAIPANEGGCAYYRIIAPMRKLADAYPDQVEVRFNKNPLGIDEKTGAWQENWEFKDMKWADIVFTQNICNYGGNYTARICGKAKEFGKFFHFDTDDLLTNLYDGHRLKGVYKEKRLDEITKFIYSNSDLVTVTQSKFANRIKQYCPGILAVVKNAIDYTLPCWNGPKIPQPRKNIVRIGWAGGIHHEEDVKEFAGIPHFVNQRVGRENVIWDFYGRPPSEAVDDKWQSDVWDNYQRILLHGFKGAKNWNIHNAMSADSYGYIFSNMDVAIAPLQMNDFNDSKSEIKVAECGRYKIPLIASDVGCYSETIKNGHTGYLIPTGPKSKKEWVRILCKIVKDHKHRIKMGQNLHEVTEEYFDLNKVAVHRLGLYQECFSMYSKDRSESATFNLDWKV